MHPCATHLPVLLACLRHTNGPILEMGAGWFSTPLVGAFSVDRLARTVEADAGWHSTVAPICTRQSIVRSSHQLLYVPSYDQAPIEDQAWSLGIIDHGPAERRVVDIERLRGRCELIIAHDSEHEAYGYEPAFAKFRHRFTYSRLTPWTTVVSDTDPLDWLDEALAPLW